MFFFIVSFFLYQYSFSIFFAIDKTPLVDIVIGLIDGFLIVVLSFLEFSNVAYLYLIEIELTIAMSYTILNLTFKSIL
jgi:hypothetical protein